MYNAKAYSAASATSPLASTTIPRRDPTEDDVEIEILFCGICHSDVHQVRNEWSGIMPTVYLLDPHSFGGAANTSAMTNVLQTMGVPCHVIPKEFLDKPQSRPGQEGEWEWHNSATGKAILVHAPINADWRRLG